MNDAEELLKEIHRTVKWALEPEPFSTYKSALDIILGLSFTGPEEQAEQTHGVDTCNARCPECNCPTLWTSTMNLRVLWFCRNCKHAFDSET